MIKKYLRFITEKPILGILITLALCGASLAVIYILRFILPMSLGLLMATMVTFPMASTVILVTIATVGILLVVVDKRPRIAK